MVVKSRYFLLVTLCFLLCGGAVYIWHQPRVENTPKRFNLAEIVNIKNEEKKSIKAIPASTDSSVVDSNEQASDFEFWEHRKKISNDELQNFIEQDDICKLIISEAALKDGVLALLKAPDKIKVDAEKDKMLEELFGGAMKGTESKNENADLILDYYNALLFADLLMPVQGIYKDLNRADIMLADLEARDPDNGAYTFFRAFVLHKKNVDNTQIKNEFLKSFHAPRINFFITDITQRILEKSYSSSAYYHLATESMRQMPIPDSYSVYKLLQELLKSSDVAFNQGAYSLGMKMMEPGLRVKGERDFVFWDGLEYTLGFNIVRYSSKVAYPDLPKKKYKDYRDPIPAYLIDRQTLFDLGAKNMVSFSDFFDKLIKEKTCLREAYDKAVKEDEQNYLNFLK